MLNKDTAKGYNQIMSPTHTPKVSHLTWSPCTSPKARCDLSPRPQLPPPASWTLFQPRWPPSCPLNVNQVPTSGPLHSCSLSLEYSSQPPTRLLPSCPSGPHSKRHFLQAFQEHVIQNYAPILLPSIPLAWFRTNKKRWGRRNVGSRGPEDPGSDHITDQYQSQAHLVRVHAHPVGSWWLQPHLSSWAIPVGTVTDERAMSSCVYRTEMPWEQRFCFPHTVSLCSDSSCPTGDLFAQKEFHE